MSLQDLGWLEFIGKMSEENSIEESTFFHSKKKAPEN